VKMSKETDERTMAQRWSDVMGHETAWEELCTLEEATRKYKDDERELMIIELEDLSVLVVCGTFEEEVETENEYR
jgi:hypothetical protein